MPEASLGSWRPRRFRLFDVVRLLGAWLLATIALSLADLLLPGLTAESFSAYLVATAVAGVLGLVFRPALVLATAWIGWLALVVAALVGQALVVFAAIWLVPGITATFWAAFWASWIVAGVGTLAAWLGTAGSDDSFTASLLRRRRAPVAVTDPDPDGVVFVQLDGVSYPVLRWAIQAGAVPTMRRWVTSRSYVLGEWTVQLPCTTPASQLGILHGTLQGVPAFRWYDRATGRVLVANRPEDAALIERRASNGAGLLRDDGFSVGNLFTGDAPRAVLTVSRAGAAVRGSTRTRRDLARFLLDPHGFTRVVVRSVAELGKERWQAARQVRLDVVPRIERGWTFAGLRAATNVVQRDLNTAVVAEEMRRGTKSIYVDYVDYVDYDEIAHHAGIFRPEALAALDGLDRVLATLERLAAQAARRYRIVVLSDHGQSQGQTFRDRFDLDLSELCTQLINEDVASVNASVEDWGRAGSLAEGLAGPGVAGRIAGRAAASSELHIDRSIPATADDLITVLGSGNLGLLYVRSPTRLRLEELDRRWPSLIPGLCAHAGIGFVAGLDVAGVPWVIGPRGRRRLDALDSTGEDPLAAFGPHAARVLGRAVLMPEAPDLYINSEVDDGTADIAAFEPLVGAHGGLGGWQDRGRVLVPRTLAHLLPPEPIEGADQVHALLVSMLRALGHRQATRVGPEPPPPPETLA